MVPWAMKRIMSSTVKKKRTTDCGRIISSACFNQQNVVRREYRDACLYQGISPIAVFVAVWNHEFEHKGACNIRENAGNLRMKKARETQQKKKK